MNPEDFFRIGSYGAPNYGTATPSFNNQALSGVDFTGQAAIDSSKYMSTNPMAGMGGPGSGGSPSGSGWNFLNSKDEFGNATQGWGGMALGAVQGIGSMYMGLRQYGLAKDQLKQGKEQFNKNYAAQRTTTNSALEDRQRARVASNGSAYESVGDYMNKNRIN